eukprot:Colp12_sorted_trinity150504_noHs@12082
MYFSACLLGLLVAAAFASPVVVEKRAYELQHSLSANQFAQSNSVNTFIALSDLHVNPFYDPKVLPKYHCADYRKPVPAFDASLDFAYGKVDCDSPWSLVNKTLDSAATHPVDFILLLGDFVYHDVKNYAIHKGGNVGENALDVTKDILSKVFAYSISKWPNTPIFAALGNEDFYDDYNSSAAWIAQITETFTPILNSTGNPQALQTFRAGGFYRGLIGSDLVILVLNTVTYSTRNPNTNCQTADPFGQFAWLESELKNAQNSNQSVYIIGHIAPGISSFGLQAQWYDCFIQAYQNVTLPYLGKTIKSELFGHEHEDLMRINGPKQGPNDAVLLQASVTPIFGNNPAYRIYSYDKQAGYSLSDISEQYLNVSIPKEPVFNTFISSYKTEYNLPSLSADSWRNFAKSLKNPALFAKYWNNIVTGGRASKPCSDSVCQTQEICEMITLTVADWKACVAEPDFSGAGNAFAVPFMAMAGLLVSLFLV